MTRRWLRWICVGSCLKKNSSISLCCCHCFESCIARYARAIAYSRPSFDRPGSLWTRARSVVFCRGLANLELQIRPLTGHRTFGWCSSAHCWGPVLICIHRWKRPRMRCRRLPTSSTDPRRLPRDLRATTRQDSTDAAVTAGPSISRIKKINFFGPQ